MNKIVVSSTDDIPNTKHWAILTSKSITIPGDERSRSCPGHGYPERVVNYVTYTAYADHDQWTTMIEQLVKTNVPFKAIAVVPAQVTTQTVISIE
jgi:hypothetical protein